jgi:hypothetical protein
MRRWIIVAIIATVAVLAGVGLTGGTTPSAVTVALVRRLD